MNTPDKISPNQNSPSRREFLANAALLSGGLMTFGIPFFSSTPRSAKAAVMSGGAQSTAGARYALNLNGAFAGPLIAIDSGFIYGQVGKALGPTQHFKKHLTGIVYEDITMQCGNDMAPSFYSLIQQTINGQPAEMNGAILTTGAQNQIVDGKEFHDALVTEVVFPGLDATSNERAYLELKIKPGQTVLQSGGGGQINFPSPNQFPLWRRSNFRLEIDGLDEACAYVMTVDPIVWKQPVNQAPTSFQQSTQPFDLSNLVITLPQHQAEPFAQWFHDFVIQGQASDSQEKNGRLEYLGHDHQTPIMVLEFFHLGIFRMSPVKSEANTAGVPKVKVEMYCENMQLTQTPGGGSSGTQSSPSSTQSQPPPPRPKSSIRPLRPPIKNFAPRLPLQKKQ